MIEYDEVFLFANNELTEMPCNANERTNQSMHKRIHANELDAMNEKEKNE